MTIHSIAAAGFVPHPWPQRRLWITSDAAVDLLCCGGVEKLTLNTLAKAAHYAPGHFHARVGGRAGLLELLVTSFADRWGQRVMSPLRVEEDLAWLPNSPDAVDIVRCWHAAIELAYGEARAGRDTAARTLAALNVREQNHLYEVLGFHLGRRPSNIEVLLLQAAVHGLREVVAAPARPMTWEMARNVLSHLLQLLGGSPLPDLHAEESNE